MELTQVQPNQLEQVQSIYWVLLDSSPEYAATLRWKKQVYPARQDWLHYIDRGEMYFLCQDGQIVGAAALTAEQAPSYQRIRWSVQLPEDAVAVLHLFVLLPEHQGKGYAGKALTAMADFARAAGKKALRLDAVATNHHAQALYARFGFRFCGREQLYYESTGLTDFLFYEYIL